MELTEADIYPLVQRCQQRLRNISTRFRRYLYEKINWESRIVGIKGARGVGKTTLLLQHLHATDPGLSNSIYASMDDLWFSIHTLEDLVEYLYPRGINVYYLDEVHKYSSWSQSFKTLYDTYPDIRIRYTGSALLAIDHSIADLSRRQSLYTLNGMSFREFLEYEEIISMAPISMEDLVKNHVEISNQLASKIKIIKHFSDYLEYGYYPFYKENKVEFLDHLAEVVRVVIEVDIPEAEDVSASTIAKLKTLMMVMAENAPLEPNISRLSERLNCSRDLCLKMLHIMDKARLLHLLFYHPNTYKQIKGPEKVLVRDTNILHALTANVNIGTSRETFFVNQLSNIGELTLAKQGDYVFNGKYIFEVGGPNKKFTQIADLPNSFLAIDNIETGYGARIPLYLFGMLY